MNKIVVQLPADRDYAGKLEIQNVAGKRIAGPFRCCGRADDDVAQSNKNPRRDPLLPFGDLPFGEYQIVKILPSGEGTAYSAAEFGSAGIILLRPKLGDAALADANGRFGFFIQGGAKSSRGLLRPTLDGSLRLPDGDQRRFVSALKKYGVEGFCLVVSTAKLGAKVAVAKVSSKSRRNTPATLLLAGSVAASTVSGIVRQAWIRTMFNTAGSAIASGVAFVAAEEHAHAQPSDYHPTGNASAADQLNAADQHGQNATHATTDEQAHDEAGKVFDTSAPTPPPVYLNNDNQVVAPNAASGNLPPASASGVAPGSPIVTAPEPSTEETPVNTPTETQPENQNPPEGMAPAENTTAPETTTPETAPTENTALETTPATTPAETPSQPPAQEEMKDAVAEPPAVSTAPENQTAPATESVVQSSVPSLGATAAAAAGAAIGSGIAAPTAQEPASQAIIEHDNQNSASVSANTVAPAVSPQNVAANPRAAAAADFATENALPHDDGTYGEQKCATYVTDALTSSGIALDKTAGGYSTQGKGYAKNLGPVLENAGFRSIFNYSGSGELDFKDFKPQKGDVVVIQPPNKTNPAGHTAIFNGKDWVSDFVQDDQRVNPDDESGGLYPGSTYRDSEPAFKVYRLPSPQKKSP